MNSVADTPVFSVDGLDEVFGDGVTEAAIEAAGELATEQCDPVGDARGSAWYKRRMAGEFTERALAEVTGVGTAREAV
jgi:carbon-monoxide dehydrogenase medium subunit